MACHRTAFALVLLVVGVDSFLGTAPLHGEAPHPHARFPVPPAGLTCVLHVLSRCPRSLAGTARGLAPRRSVAGLRMGESDGGQERRMGRRGVVGACVAAAPVLLASQPASALDVGPPNIM